MLVKFIVCVVAGLGAGIGTGLAGLSAAAVISPIRQIFTTRCKHKGCKRKHKKILLFHCFYNLIKAFVINLFIPIFNSKFRGISLLSS